MIYIWLAEMLKFTLLISQETESNNCSVKYVFWNFFKKLYKTIKESISSNFADLFTRRALKGNLDT